MSAPERYRISEEDKKKRLSEAARKAWRTRRAGKGAAKPKVITCPKCGKYKCRAENEACSGCLSKAYAQRIRGSGGDAELYSAGESPFVVCKKCHTYAAPKETGICRLCEMKD